MQILQPKSREDESDSRGWMSQTRNIITTQLDEYLVGILLDHNANYTCDTYVQEDVHKQRRTIRTRKASGPYRTLTTRREGRSRTGHGPAPSRSRSHSIASDNIHPVVHGAQGFESSRQLHQPARHPSLRVPHFNDYCLILFVVLCLKKNLNASKKPSELCCYSLYSGRQT